MKVEKESIFSFTEEEVCGILLKHLRDTKELPEMESTQFDKTRTSLSYSEQRDIYRFELTLEKGSVDE